MVLQVVDLDPVDDAAQLLDYVGQEVVRQRAGVDVALEAAVYRHRLGVADDDRELALPVHLLQPDDLLLSHLADDDLVQLHLDGHGGRTSCGSATVEAATGGVKASNWGRTVPSD